MIGVLVEWYINTRSSRNNAKLILCHYLKHIEERLQKMVDEFQAKKAARELYSEYWIPQFDLELLTNLLSKSLPKEKQCFAVFELANSLEALQYRIRKGGITQEVFDELLKNANKALTAARNAREEICST